MSRAGELEGVNVLVTGGTGFTGSVLVRKLCERGARVTMIARASSNVEPFDDLDLRLVRGDVFDPEIVRDTMRGAQLVFHVAAAFREAKVPDSFYRSVHVTSTRLLAEESLRQPDFRRFVHVSTVGVHGHIDDPPADEEYRMQPGDIYQQTKAEGERWIRDFAGAHGLPLTVIRPAAIYGPGDRRLLKLFRLARKPVVPILGYSKGLYHLIHVDDLTEMMLLAASHPAALGEAFICGNESAMPLVDIVRTVAEEYGRNPRIVRLPAWPFFVAALLCEAVCVPLGIEPPIYRRRVAFFTKDRSFDTRKIRNRLGYEYRHSSEEGLRATARWYAEQGWL